MPSAIYAGTFDPVTNGHASVIRRAVLLFDHVHVVVAVNPSKQPLFSLQERVRMIREVFKAVCNLSCASTEGYVVTFARSVGARFLVRGVRCCTDTEKELELANLNHALAPEITTVFIPAEPGLSEVSSSRLKEMAIAGRDVSRHCGPLVERKLKERLRSLASEQEGGAENAAA